MTSAVPDLVEFRIADAPAVRGERVAGSRGAGAGAMPEDGALRSLLVAYDSGDEDGSPRHTDWPSGDATRDAPEVHVDSATAAAEKDGVGVGPSLMPQDGDYEALPEPPPDSDDDLDAPPQQQTEPPARLEDAGAAFREREPPSETGECACAPAAWLADVELPPAPEGGVRPELLAKLARFHALVASGREGVNASLRRSKAYANPDFVASAAQHMKLDQHCTGFPAGAGVHPADLRPEDAYDALQLAQRQQAEQREVERQRRQAVEFVSAPPQQTGGPPQQQQQSAFVAAAAAARLIASRMQQK